MSDDDAGFNPFFVSGDSDSEEEPKAKRAKGSSTSGGPNLGSLFSSGGRTGAGSSLFSSGGLSSFTAASVAGVGGASSSSRPPPKSSGGNVGGKLTSAFLKGETVQPKQESKSGIQKITILNADGSPMSDSDSDEDEEMDGMGGIGAGVGAGGEWNGEDGGEDDENNWDEDGNWIGGLSGMFNTASSSNTAAKKKKKEAKEKFDFAKKAEEKKKEKEQAASALKTSALSGAASSKTMGPKLPVPQTVTRKEYKEFDDPILKYMLKQNWDPTAGLGKDESGIVNPVEGAYGRAAKMGIQDNEKAQTAEELYEKPEDDDGYDGWGGGATGSKKKMSAADILLGKDRVKELEAKDKKNQRKLFGADGKGKGKDGKGGGRFEDKYAGLSGKEKVRKQRIEYIDGLAQAEVSINKGGMKITDYSRAGGPQVMTGDQIKDGRTKREGEVFGGTGGVPREAALKELLVNVAKLVRQGADEIFDVKRQIKAYTSSLEVLGAKNIGNGSLGNGIGPINDDSKAKTEYITKILDELDSKVIKEKTRSSKQKDFEFVLEKFEGYKKENRKAFAEFELNLTAAEHLLPGFRQIISSWEPGDEEDDYLPRLKDVLLLDKPLSSSVYDLFMADSLVPRVRSLATAGDLFINITKSQMRCADALSLIQIAKDYLPEGNFVNLTRLTIRPKLEKAVEKWDCESALLGKAREEEARLMEMAEGGENGENGSSSDLVVSTDADYTPDWLPHQWLFPFFDLFPEEDDVPRALCKLLKKKLCRFFESSWKPTNLGRARIGASVLTPWKGLVDSGPKKIQPTWNHGPQAARDKKDGNNGVFTKADWSDLCGSCVDGLRQYIYPDANVSLVKMVTPFKTVIPAKGFGLLIEQLFFTPLREWMYRTLSSSSDDLAKLAGGARYVRDLYTKELKPLLGMVGGIPNRILRTSGIEGFMAEILCFLECFVLDKGSGPSAWVKAKLLEGEEETGTTTASGGPRPGGVDAIRTAISTELLGVQSADGTSQGIATGQSVREKNQKLLQQWREEEQKRKDELRFDHLREPEVTMRQALEDGAGNKNVLFQQRTGFRSESGQQWYSIGKKFVYWEDDVVFVSDKLVSGGVGKPVALETVLGMVY